MKIGCHAVLFTDKILTDTDTVLAQIQETGGQGAEIGARFFGVEKSAELKEKMEQYGLELSGLHVTIKLTDLLDDTTKAQEALEKAAGFLRDMPNKNIILTGLAMDNPADESAVPDSRLLAPQTAKQMALQLNALAVKIKQTGVQVHYHNHCWEFDNEGLLFFAIADNAPDVKFALDTGWAAVSGYDPVELFEKYPGRFGYVHLRDYTEESLKGKTFAALHNGFTDVGTGIMNYPRLMKKLQEILGESGWAVIEYEKGDVDYTRYTRAVDFLKKILAEIQ